MRHIKAWPGDVLPLNVNDEKILILRHFWSGQEDDKLITEILCEMEIKIEVSTANLEEICIRCLFL